MRWEILLLVAFAISRDYVDGRLVNKDDVTTSINDLEDDVAKLLDALNDFSADGTKVEADTHNKDNTDDTGDFIEDGHSVTEEIQHVNENLDLDLEETDIMPRPNETKQVANGGNDKRNAVRDTSYLWTSRDIGYEFDAALPTSAQVIIHKAMDTLSNNSCIQFHMKRDDDKHWLLFFDGGGCWSYVGKIESKIPQRISIASGCEYKGIVMHELLHALGFYHEQSRYDRDRYIEINWENIDAKYARNFEKKSENKTRNLNSVYDYESILHYSANAFSNNGQPVIVVLGAPKAKIGQRSYLSTDDILSLKDLYHCDTTNTLGESVWTEWSSWGGCHVFSPSRGCEKKRYRFCGSGTCPCTTNETNSEGCGMEMSGCTHEECKVDGHWSHWSSWSTCDVTGHCQMGRKRSTRTCTNPAPALGGKACNGTDNIKFEPCEGMCPTNCTFNENDCEYTLNGRWRRRDGATTSPYTGPSGDVDGNGKYVYMEASGISAGTKFRLQSPLFNTTNGPQCFSIRYHMYGSAMGSLVAYLTVDSAETKLWEAEGDHGNEWKKAEFDVESRAPFRMTFVAVCGTSYQGDSALDNLFLHDKPCDNPVTLPPATTPVGTGTTPVGPGTTPVGPGTIPVGPGSTTVGPPVGPGTTPVGPGATSVGPGTTPVGPGATSVGPGTTPVGPGATSVGPGTTPVGPGTTPVGPVGTTIPPVTAASLLSFNCSFDNGDLCGMKVVSIFGPVATPMLHWTPSDRTYRMMTSVNKRYDTEPIQDRVAERGYFLAVHADRTEHAERSSTVFTPSFSGEGPQDVELFYYMWQNGTILGSKAHNLGLLEVSLVTSKLKAGWKSCVVLSTTGSRNGVWEYQRVHVDVPVGVKFFLKFTAVLGKAQSTIAIDDVRGIHRELKKKNRRFHSPSALSCSFNSIVNSSCFWQLSGDFKWLRRSGETSTPNTGPKEAVTIVTDDHYMYAEASYPQKSNDIAVMLSPLMITSRPVCMVFFSHTYGADIGSLKVGYTTTGSNGVRTRNIKDITVKSWGEKWQERRFPLPTGKLFQVEINATVGNGPEGDIAIDNIIAIPGACRGRTYQESVICDFEQGSCEKSGVTGKSFSIAKEDSTGTTSTTTMGANNYYKATHTTLDYAQVEIALKEVDQFGACMKLSYRVKTEGYNVARIAMRIYLPSSRVVTEWLEVSAEGNVWQPFEVDIPPRASRGNISVKFYASFVGSTLGNVKEIDIDDIRMSDGICRNSYTSMPNNAMPSPP